MNIIYLYTNIKYTLNIDKKFKKINTSKNPNKQININELKIKDE